MYSLVNLSGHDYEEDLDEEIAVQEVVRNMLDKQVVKDNVLKDLGFDSKKSPIDPRTKMELRHKQVLNIDYFVNYNLTYDRQYMKLI